MIQWSPNMKSRSGGGNYSHSDTNLRGYAPTNLAGPGCGATGDDPILPMVGSAPTNTRDYDIQVSTDATTYTTVAKVRGITANATTTAANTSGRYVRVNVLQAEQASGTGGA